MKRKGKLFIIIVGFIIMSCVSISVKAADEPAISLKYNSKSVYRNKSFKNELIAATGKVTWKSSNKRIAVVSRSGVITGKAFGKCYISAKSVGKTYKCLVRVIRHKPNFDAEIVDVDDTKSGKDFVKVRFRNYSGKKLIIMQKAKYNDYTKPTYLVKSNSKKGITIKGHKSKTVTFYNYGKYEIWNHAGRKDPDIFADALHARIKYSFKFDDKKYTGITKWLLYYDEDYQEMDYYSSTYSDGIPTKESDR